MNKRIIKIDKEHSILMEEIKEGYYNLFHLMNGIKINDIYPNNPEYLQNIKECYLYDEVNLLANKIINNILKTEYSSEMSDTSIIVECTYYEVWIDAIYNEDTNKIIYYCEAINNAKMEQTGEYEQSVGYKQERKTIKGLKNYIEFIESK